MTYGNPPQRLYAIEFADGIVKVGITSDAAERARKYTRTRAARRQFFATEHVTGVAAEAALIAKVARIGVLARGREWFTGITFEQASQLVQEVTEQFVHPDPGTEKSPLLRTTYGKLSFNDDEVSLLDAYCTRFGISRAVACRKLILDAAQRKFSVNSQGA